MNVFSFFTMVAFILTDSALAYPINCDNYFSTCTCESNYYDTMGNYGYMVKCANMSTANIQKVLTKPTSKIDNKITTLYLAPNDTNLVAKITGSRTFFALILDCSSAPNNMLLFNPDALSSTKIDTYALTIQNCNLIKFSWSFLTNFTYLYSISISNSSNIHTTFSTLPVKTLPWLKRLEVNRIKGINGFGNAGLTFPSSLSSGLSYLSISGGNNGDCKDCSIGDIALGKLFSWITPSSIKTLSTVMLNGNSLTQIPADIVKFNQLSQFSIKNLQPMKIQSNAFNISKFKDSYLNLDFGYSQITAVNPGAFQGNYSGAYVYMSYNNLTTLQSGAFQKMIEQMRTYGGSISVYDNPFNCNVSFQCDLAWLIRNPTWFSTYPYYGPVYGAQCSNGTSFYQLDPSALRTPSGKPCP